MKTKMGWWTCTVHGFFHRGRRLAATVTHSFSGEYQSLGDVTAILHYQDAGLGASLGGSRGRRRAEARARLEQSAEGSIYVLEQNIGRRSSLSGLDRLGHREC